MCAIIVKGMEGWLIHNRWPWTSDMERITPHGALTVCDLVACTLLVEQRKALVGGLMRNRSPGS